MAARKLKMAQRREIQERRARGEGVAEIARDMGVSTGTVSTVAREAPRPAPPAGLEVVLAGEGGSACPTCGRAGPADELEELLASVRRLARMAEAEANLSGVATLGRLTTAILDLKRKAAPPERPDANEHPDMVAAARRAREALHRLIDTSPEVGP